MVRPQRFCIFCDGPGLSRTHIWPEWLDKLLKPPDGRPQRTNNSRVSGIRSNVKQGSMFSQKPYLCCVACNTGWMRRFEDEMTKFAKPIFTSLETVTTLDETQTRVFGVWISLITVLAQFTDHKEGVSISKEDRAFIKRYLRPPDNWTIIASSSKSKTWYAKYRNYSLGIGDFASPAEQLASIASGRPNNTQISTFGMGKLVVQVFSCPNERYVQDYRAALKKSGMIQIWPVRRRFWPFPKRPPQFPTNAVLDDEQATIFAEAFNDRLRYIADPNSWVRPAERF